MKKISVLGQDIDKNYMISKLMEMGFDDESAEIELDYLIDSLYNLEEPLKLYRIIFVDDIQDINLEKPGSHYSINKKDLLNSYSFCTGCGDEAYLLTINASKNLINVNETLINNILFPNENEITLRNKGKNCEIVKINKIRRK